MFNTLTVEHSRLPGQNFERKVLRTSSLSSFFLFFFPVITRLDNGPSPHHEPPSCFVSLPSRNIDAFKIQSHLMFYDTSHNSHATVLETLRTAFRQTALKMWAYMRVLGRTSRPRPDVVKRTFLFPFSSLYLFSLYLAYLTTVLILPCWVEEKYPILPTLNYISRISFFLLKITPFPP